MARTESETNHPFKRFEKLAKALFSVPKKELDKELAEYGRRKAKIGTRKHEFVLFHSLRFLPRFGGRCRVLVARFITSWPFAG